MGDKSPKAKERQKQHDDTQKRNEKAAAVAKAKPAAAPPLKGGK